MKTYKYAPYSYSKIATFSSCPYSFNLGYIQKIKVELDEENLALVKDIDIAELCITSSFTLKAVKNNEIKVVAEKALGNKCPVCWKLSLQPCLRHET